MFTKWHFFFVIIIIVFVVIIIVIVFIVCRAVVWRLFLITFGFLGIFFVIVGFVFIIVFVFSFSYFSAFSLFSSSVLSVCGSSGMFGSCFNGVFLGVVAFLGGFRGGVVMSSDFKGESELSGRVGCGFGFLFLFVCVCSSHFVICFRDWSKSRCCCFNLLRWGSVEVLKPVVQIKDWG